MSSRIYWVDEPWILAVEYTGHVSVADVQNAAHQCLAAMQERPVYFLIDLSQSASVETGVIELASFSEWIYHPNARWFAYVKPSGLFKSVIQVRHRDAAKLFLSRAEALNFLQKAVRYATQE